MNAFGASLLWGILQVTLFTFAGLAVYLIARRRGPAAGSLAASACLLMAVGVSILALSPWPHWVTLAPADRAAADGAASSTSNGATADSSSAEPTNPAATNAEKPGVATLSRAEQAAVAWQAFWQELGRTPLQPDNTEAVVAAPRWPAVVGAAFVAGLLLGLVRLALGLSAVRRLRANTRPIADARLAALAAELCARLKCTRRIELRESLQLTSPATIGWRRPLVILPSDWRAWTAEERRVVLAHEIAHVGRGDYVTGLLGQFSLALHFYHPLVHWLARRLRLELELAADALGAEVSGGREAYLFILAQMALRQDDRAIAWAARPFLPSRGAFLRRIDMLRDPRQFRAAAMSRGRQVAIVSLVVAVGLLFAGLRGPAGQSLAQQPKSPAKPVLPGAVAATPADAAEASAGDWSFVPANAAVVAIIRPAAMLSRAEMQPLAKMLNEQAGVEKQLDLKVADLEELKVILPSFPTPAEPQAANPGIFVLRAKQAHDWKAFGDKAAGEPVAASFLGKNYVKPSPTFPRN
ncbi:MAG TPA: M56 family metallopeptidase, partial [Pirellulales bacterium]|nr:M56 family metallopeptidase [Pirellulales bacterium]